LRPSLSEFFVFGVFVSAGCWYQRRIPFIVLISLSRHREKSRFMSKTTDVLKTRQTIVFHFVLGYKLEHSCTYRQIALNYRIYSIKAPNLKLAPTSNNRPWKENSRSAHPHPQPSPPPPPIQLQQNQQKLQWTRRVGCFRPICTLPIRCSCVPTDPLFLLILLTLCSYCVPSF